MKKVLIMLLLANVALLNLPNASFARTHAVKATRQASRLAAKLPSSDLGAQIDLQRLLSVSLPQIVNNAKPQILTGVNAKIDEIKAQTGIDLRQFDQVAVGVKYPQNPAATANPQAVALISGKYDMNTLLAAMKLAAKDKFREEKSGARTIYIFTPKQIAPTLSLPPISLPGLGVIVDFNKILSGELAVAALDKSTLAFGSPARVRETLESKLRIGQDVLALINRNANAAVSFGGNIPANFLSKRFNLEDDSLGKSLDSIRQLCGAFDAANNTANVSVTAKTTGVQQATDLETTVSGFQMLGKSLLGGMRGADKAVYARMAENAKITRNADEVNLSLQVPQSDIDVLLGKK